MNTKLSLFIVLCGLSYTAVAQSEKPVESKISNVTVFLARAQVTREVKTKIDAGKTYLVVSDLTAQLDPQSIQVSGRGNFIILGTSHRQNFLSELNMPKALKVLKDSAEYFQKQIALEQSQKEILNKEEQMLLSNQKIGGTNQNLTVAELKAMADFYRSRLGDIVNSRMKQDEKIKNLNNRLGKIQSQINSQNELYSRNTSEIVISLSASTPTAVELEVNYVANQAGWLPVYDVRATNTKSPLQLNYKANVFQQTGEQWKNVHLKLSTANPNLGGLKPELYAWYLDFYQPVAMMKAQQDRRSAMPMAMRSDDLKKEEAELSPAETAAQFVNAIQTTLNTEFDISLPYTVASSNQPTLVDIRNYDVNATYQYSVVPKLDMDAFLMAKATGWEEYNLLPGEANIFFEGTFVGKTFIDPNSVKDTLSLSLGRDKRIVVKRERVKDFTSRKAIGANVRETQAYELSVRNTKQEAIKIVIEDQVPLSQNSQIEVLVTDTGGAGYLKDTGKLSWTWNLQPNETKKTVFKFEVKYPKDKPISGL
ncbi:MAG TPA: DUF4139 domain-containing protein [Cyclobacteriaceae bacterium]|nr:DUF4139 domain-containing protein [Cyclobacteriaceae bacterium]